MGISTVVPTAPNAPAAELDPLDHVATLAERVADAVRERIVKGSFPAGTRLLEADIARQLGTSRAPVREAMAMLRAEGLVRSEPRRGPFVAELSDSDIAEIHDLRAAIEGHAARTIIARGDRAAVDSLRAKYEALRRAAGNGDRPGYATALMDFHGELCRRSANRRLYGTWVNLSALLGVLIRVSVASGEEPLETLRAEHEELLAAISSGDPDRAYAACELHMVRATGRLIRVHKHLLLAATQGA